MSWLDICLGGENIRHRHLPPTYEMSRDRATALRLSPPYRDRARCPALLFRLWAANSPGPNRLYTAPWGKTGVRRDPPALSLFMLFMQ